MPIERAVPAMIFSAASIEVAFRSGILVSAICRTWAAVSEPTLVLCGSALPLSTPAAFLIISGAGGVLVMNVNDRSSKIEISTGMMLPRWASVAALYCFTKSMMLTPCGPRAVPTGGGGVAAPAGSWPLTMVLSFFLGGIAVGFLFLIPGEASRLSELRYLVERELDGRLAAEDGHEHLELLGDRVDLVHGRRERRERAVHNGNRLAGLVFRRRLLGGGRLRRGGPLARGGGEQRRHLAERQRRRLARQADEAGHARGVPDHGPGLIGQLHPDQDVARQHLLVDDLLLAALDLGHQVGGDLDLEDVVLHVERRDAALEVGLDPVLVAGVRVDDVPVAGLHPHLAHELGEGVVLARRRDLNVFGLGLGVVGLSGYFFFGVDRLGVCRRGVN